MSLVYSTDSGRMCPQCRKPVAACECGKKKAPAGDGIGRVQREKRNGKVVTVVKGLALEDAALAALGKQLRAQCGSGGTVKDGAIEVQGDHADKIMAALLAAGYKAKRAGG
jgi:translation initiation factor 1